MGYDPGTSESIFYGDTEDEDADTCWDQRVSLRPSRIPHSQCCQHGQSNQKISLKFGKALNRNP